MARPVYVTTPIYYVNDRPHIGHAYSTVAADVVSRYARLRGKPTYFLTGLDEHGLKIERRAKEEGLAPQDFVDQMAAPFRSTWEELGCAHDGFIRTTSAQHRDRVQALWKLMQDKGDIYLDDYEDWYCVGCESFKTEKELLEGKLCPVHQTPVERIKERSYFFRLSNYTQPLLDYYAAHPEFVRPDARFNEVKAFLAEGLRDLSISRTSFRWGVAVPGDPEHVVYVWLDALMNYVSALGGPAEEGEAPLYDEFWQSSLLARLLDERGDPAADADLGPRMAHRERRKDVQIARQLPSARPTGRGVRRRRASVLLHAGGGLRTGRGFQPP